MGSFFERLEVRARKINSLLCVGLDPVPQDLEEATPEAVRNFCFRLIEATADQALAFKPNSAFFEAFGAPGVAVLEEVIASIPPEIPVILDAKRGDIASTAQAYARAAFQVMRAQAITLNPYLGYDAIQPFLADAEKGVFLLCKTSNPGAADLQNQVVVGGPHPLLLFERVALLAQEWNRLGNLGLVVGATHPEALERVRQHAPEMWILAPGVGAQGGDLEAALQAGLRGDGLGLLIPVSRLLSHAPDARRAAQEVVAKINRIKDAMEKPGDADRPFRKADPNSPPSRLDLAFEIHKVGCVQFGEFTLKSGQQSPIYIDLRRIIGYPSLLDLVAAAYVKILREITFDRLAALPYAAIPIATAISLRGKWPLIYPRKEAKAYGTKVEIEGVFQAGERVVVIDDLITTGGSKLEAVTKLKAAGLQVDDIVVLIDRRSGAANDLHPTGYKLHSVFTILELVDIWVRAGVIPIDQAEKIYNFIGGAG
jgi:uridine monophosphate synthetase